MIRRKSIVLFVVFLVLLAGILFINQDSNLQVKLGMQTATPTQQPFVISGFDFASLSGEEIHNASGSANIKIIINQKGEFETENKIPVNTTTLLQSTDALKVLRGTSTLDSNTPLDKVGLNQPQIQLTLIDQKGNHGTLAIGNITATQSDYYVRWENNPVTLVSKNQIDALLGYYSPDSLLVLTPAPGKAITPAP